MNKQNWKPYALWIALAEAVGILSGLLSRSGMDRFQEGALQSPLSPPPILFPIVWTILYALMGIGAAQVASSPDSPQRSRALNLFIAQLIVNFFWSPIFFNANAFGFAFGWLILLWVLVALMILAFRNVNPPVAWLQIPYLIWLTFAAYLNYQVWMLNQ